MVEMAVSVLEERNIYHLEVQMVAMVAMVVPLSSKQKMVSIHWQTLEIKVSLLHKMVNLVAVKIKKENQEMICQ